MFHRFYLTSLIMLFFSATIISFFTTGCGKDYSQPEPDIFLSGISRQTIELPLLDADSNLDDYIHYAILNSPALNAASQKYQSEYSRIRQAGSLPDPNLQYKYFTEDERSSIGISQMFPAFGKLRLRSAVAYNQALAAEAEYETERRRIILKVMNAYAEYYYLARSIEVTGENLKIVKALEEVLNVRYRTDAATFGDLTRLQIEIGELENRLQSMKDMVRPSAAQINSVLNRPQHLEIPLPGAMPEYVFDIDEESALNLVQRNPELHALRWRLNAGQEMLRLAKRESYPDLMLGIEVEEMKAEDGMDENQIVAMLSINLPVWRSKYRSKIIEAEAMLEMYRYELSERENLLESELQMAFFNYRDALRRRALYSDTLIPKAVQSLNAVQQSFATGKSGFLDVMESLRKVLELNLLHERALADILKSHGEIAMLTGGVLTIK